jgi:hypothetical protein
MSSAHYPVFAAYRLSLKPFSSWFLVLRSLVSYVSCIVYSTVSPFILYTPHATGCDMAEGSDNLQIRVATTAITDKSSPLRASTFPGELEFES